MTKYMALTVLLGLSVCVSGCKTTSGCDGFRKIPLTSHDVEVISDKLANGVLAHNEFGRKIGCW